MRTSNVARFVEGELVDPPGVRTILILNPSTAEASRRAALQPHRPELRVVTSLPKSERQCSPGAPAYAAVAPNTEATNPSIEAGAKAFLIATAALLAFSSALLLQYYPQWPANTPVAAHSGTLSSNEQASANALPPQSKAPVIVLTSPPKLEGKVGEGIRFAMSIDATEALPARSLVAISNLPELASFSEGRPHGITGWTLRPDEIGDLWLLLSKAEIGSYNMSMELLAGDGSLLAQSDTRLNIRHGNERLVASADASEIPTPESFARPPRKNKVTSETTESTKVTPVKTLVINAGAPPPAPKVADRTQHDAEWVLVVRSVNVHPSPNRASKTIKVANKGAKLRVLARKRGWVQVSNPTASVKGWVYGRFVKAATPPDGELPTER